MSNDGVNTSRRTFLIGLTSAIGAAGAVGAAVPFVKSWQPSAKAKFGNLKPCAKPRGQVISRQKDMACFCHAILKTEEWIIKQGRDRNVPVPPDDLIRLVLHLNTAYGRSGPSNGRRRMTWQASI